ncbi:MAG: hypothetical protein AAFP19_05985 [Bacteroidota bacterium]
MYRSSIQKYLSEINLIIASILIEIQQSLDPKTRLNHIATRHNWIPEFEGANAQIEEDGFIFLPIPVQFQTNGYDNIYLHDRTHIAGQVPYYKLKLIFEEKFTKKEWSDLYEIFFRSFRENYGDPDKRGSIELLDQHLFFNYWPIKEGILGLQQSFELNPYGEQTLDVIFILSKDLNISLPVGAGTVVYRSFRNTIQQLIEIIKSIVPLYKEETSTNAINAEMCTRLLETPNVKKIGTTNLLYLSVGTFSDWMYPEFPLIRVGPDTGDRFINLYCQLVNVTNSTPKGIHLIFSLIKEQLVQELRLFKLIKEGEQKDPHGEELLPYVYWQYKNVTIGLQDSRVDAGHTDPSINLLLLPYNKSNIDAIPIDQIDDLQ